jgi:hypothetical protein
VIGGYLPPKAARAQGRSPSKTDGARRIAGPRPAISTPSCRWANFRRSNRMRRPAREGDKAC